MGRIYHTKLNIKSNKVLETFKRMAGVYRKMFNWGISAQFYKMTVNFWPKDQLISASNLLNVANVGKAELYPYISEVDSGITKRAVFNSQFSFTQWYHLRKTRLPEYLARKRGMNFSTSTKVKVFYDHIAIPKLGKIKLYEKGYIPQGMVYKNVSFSYDGSNWWISLEACEKNSPEATLEGSCKVSVDLDGRVTVGGKAYENVIEASNYKAQKGKRAKLVKKLKRQKAANSYRTASGKIEVRTSRNMMKTRKHIQRVSHKMQEIKNDSFRKIVGDLAKTKPAEVQLLSVKDARDGYNKYLSRYQRESSTRQLLGMIQRRALSLGSKVTRYSERQKVS